MKMTRLKNKLSVILCIVLIAAMALLTTGCNGNTTTPPEDSPTTQVPADGSVLGEGATRFTFTVTDGEGNQASYQINTDKKTVGDALIELNLIAGKQDLYGLYVKTVNGITVDYDKDGKYWAFYVNGKYASSGVDSTAIEAGATYSFKIEK